MKRVAPGQALLGCMTLLGCMASARAADLVPTGEALFARHCLACHAPGGNYPGTVALGVKYGGTLPAVLAERRDLQPEFVRVVIRRGINIMPWYRRTELNDAEVDAIAAYLSRAR